jgi:hypothetical protein
MRVGTIDGEPEAAILALGRVAWAAITVEDRAGSLAENVLRRARGKSQISTLIRDAVLELSSREPSDAVNEAIEWFGRSSAALIERNQILHSIPTVTYPGDGEPFLVHWPNAGGPPVETPLNAVILDEIADRLQGIAAPNGLKFGSAWTPCPSLSPNRSSPVRGAARPVERREPLPGGWRW